MQWEIFRVIALQSDVEVYFSIFQSCKDRSLNWNVH